MRIEGADMGEFPISALDYRGIAGGGLARSVVMLSPRHVLADRCVFPVRCVQVLQHDVGAIR